MGRKRRNSEDEPLENPDENPVENPEQITRTSGSNEKLYAVSYLLKQAGLEITQAPWCLNKTVMSEREFNDGKNKYFGGPK